MFASFLNSAFCCFSTHDSHRHNCNKLRYMGHIHSMACPTQQRNEKENIFCSWKNGKKRGTTFCLATVCKKAHFFSSKEITASCLFYRSSQNGMSDWITFCYFLKYLIDHMINSVSNNFTIVPSKLSSCLCASSVSKHLFLFNQLV